MPQVHVVPLQAAPQRQLRNPAEPGWTVFKKTISGPNQTQVVYVANNTDPIVGGNDGYCGFNQTKSLTSCAGPGGLGGHTATAGHGPKKTLSAGQDMLRNGFPDWLLLKKGDTWTISGTQYFNANGLSPAAKQLISSYGSGARPKILLANSAIGQFALSTQNRNNIAIVDLHIEQASGSNPFESFTGYGIVCWNSNDILIEGCLVPRFAQGIGLGYGNNHTARRNVVTDVGVHGITVNGANNALVEENIIYRVGELKFLSSSSVYAHCIYFAGPENTTGYTIQNNILATSYQNGIDMRIDNGNVINNLVTRCGQGINMGDGPDYVWTAHPDLTLNISNNCLLDNREGWSVSAGEPTINVFQGLGSTIVRNIIANNSVGVGSIVVRPNLNPAMLQRNLTITENVIYQPGNDPVRVTANSGQITNLTFTKNDVYTSTTDVLLELPGTWINSQWKSGSNRFYGAGAAGWWFMTGVVGQTLLAYRTAVGDPIAGTTDSVAMGPDPLAWSFPNANGATIEGYHASISGGVGNYEAFMANAILLRKGNWQLAYTAEYINTWIRAQFGK